MMLFPQANAPRFTFSASGRELNVVDFTLRESLSAPFIADLALACEDEVAFEDIIGKNSRLTIESADGERQVHGIVNRFVHTGINGRFFLYSARLVPQVWLLSLEQDCRIFQSKSVPDIVKQILEDAGITGDLFEFRLQGTHGQREYCVQYRETDLNFISRLLEEEGIFYFFEHSAEKHLLVFGDGPVNYQPIAGDNQVPLNPGSGTVAEQEAVLTLQVLHQIRSGKYTMRDFNFEKPSLDLTAEHTDKERERLEIYDYPGEYATTEEGRKLAQVRLLETTMYKEVATGAGTVPRFLPGFTFQLTGHGISRFNREYLLTEVSHQGAQPQVLAEKAVAGAATSYKNEFVSVPASVTIRPERRSPKPVVEGVQTAIVTGPAGEEIYPDAHGRVKVQFHWDRLGQKDEHSSCWIRVSQAWAGTGWGAMFIPRIGHEVIVDFLEGDPDRPIITGRVYHGTNTPPYPLPDEKTKSTIKSDSSTGGGGSNELRFEDKQGKEEIYLHGQKDWTIAIENDKNQTVGHNESLSVSSNRTKSVGADQSETIGNNKTIRVGTNHTETIGANKAETIGANLTVAVGANQSDTVAAIKAVSIGAAYQITVGGALNETVGAAKAEEIGGAKLVNVGVSSNENVGSNKSVSAGGNISETAGKDISIRSGKKMNLTAGADLAVSGQKKAVIDIKDELTIKVGSAMIVMNKSGDILIKGKKINLKASGAITLKGSKIAEN